MLSVPVRAAPLLAATVKLTVPLPVPDAPAVIVSHSSLLTAPQVQVPPVVTVTLPVPPALGTAWLIGAMVKAQGASWVTVKVRPATVIVPVRRAPVVFDVTENS